MLTPPVKPAAIKTKFLDFPSTIQHLTGPSTDTEPRATLLTSLTVQLWVLEGKKETRRWPCCPKTSPSIKAEAHSDCSGHYKTSQKHQEGPRLCCSAQLITTQRAQPETQPARRRFQPGKVPKPALSRVSTFPAGRAHFPTQRSASCSSALVFLRFVADSCRNPQLGQLWWGRGAPAEALPSLGVSQDLEAQHSLSCISAAPEKFFLSSKGAEVAGACCVP